MPAPASPRQVTTLKTGWKFHFGDHPQGADPALADAGWQPVRIPHDWAISQPFDREHDVHFTAILEDGERKQRAHTGRTGGLPHTGKAWYRLPLDLPADLGSRRVRIEFDGVMSHSRVWCNGRDVGSWPFGYASFAFDLTPFVKPGRNLLAVSVDNKPLASRWYPGAGLFRHVRLVLTDPVHVAHWGTRVTTPFVSTDSATVSVVTTVDNTAAPGPVTLDTQILDPDGRTVASFSSTEPVDARRAFHQTLVVPRPALWSDDTPRLYTVRSSVRAGNRLADLYETSFGIRTLRFDADEGFFLNGRRVRLNGVCLHHDLGPLGAALNKAALERQLRLLRDMGCNAIRTSHNPPAPELLDLADRLGFLVLDEAFDEWRSGKVDFGYHILFDAWAEKDLRALIRRDANHPSVIMWSLGNEIREQAEPGGAEVCRFLHAIARDEDPTRPTTAGLNQSDAAIANGLAAVVDVPGWNYKPNRYADYHRALPRKPMYGSETASCVSSRGEYYFPVEEERGTRRPTLQCNSYDLTCAGWANVPDADFRGVDENPFIMGEFVWTGCDYLGEPTPYNEEWPSRSSYFGIIDLAGLPKDRFFLYQSRWAPHQRTLHLLPHWSWPERIGQVTPVHVYTCWDDVELFVNGVSQGRLHKNARNLVNRYRLAWNGVIYQPGEVKAVAYDAEGKPAAEAVIRTAGNPAGLTLSPNRPSLAADGDDMVFVAVVVTDAAGTLCPRADNLVRFSVEGPAEIAGVDNGNAASLEPFQVPYRKAFNGRCVVALRSKEGTGGPVTLRAEADGLTPARLQLQALNPT